MITIDNTKCNKDYICIDECPYGFIFEKDADGFPTVKKEIYEKYCIKCWHCISICPKAAISSPDVKQENLMRLKKEDFLTTEVAEKFIRSRRSIRKFKDETIPPETIENWLDITRWSPTASNSQKLNWIVIKDKEKLKTITGLMIDWIKKGGNYPEIVDQYEKGDDILLRHAPHLLIATLPEEYFWLMTDAATALSYLELTANSYDLGTCWAGFFIRAASEYEPLIKELDLPNNHRTGGALMFGHPVYNFKKVPERERFSLKYV
ncbi:MAG: hypothetical protein GY714_29950 [Desulfobacterales bacterium]|nr:hypothetical protein [Desulfobacterales bacterium]MCP4164141.1 hypothetical protein [Deltaproteobacteria bacterium]